ncbi:MAG: ATP-dependent DNA helicase RecG [Bacilli bacterium]|nr:ATP-dependent DNA helicase RecG [Bacilli bacterium]
MDIGTLKGIGPKTENILKNNGIMTTKDLISYYPFRYDVIKRSNIEELFQDDKIIIDGIVESKPSLFFFNKKMNKMSFKFNTGNYLMNVVIFNRGFLKSKINPGVTLTLIGKFDKTHNTIVASDIRFSKLPDIPVIEPIYHQIGGISSNQIRGYINSIDDYQVQEYVPEYLKEKYKLIEKEDAVINIHNPKNELDLKKAKAYLKYEELFLFMLKMNSLKKNKKNKIGLKRHVDKSLVMEFINKLPFKLTTDQMNAVDKIYEDLNSANRMNRLVQGDVGSGKTIVAIIALYINYLSGYQGALMAPTEVLANQHLLNLKSIFKDCDINIELLTGNLKVSEKKTIYKKLENKEIDIIIGTHALISEDVNYNNLGLVITDEQHRFGVNQRSNLKNKGITPDILYLSATPIPRTYALTIYGDMDVSSIKTMPSGRKEIITSLKSNNNIKDVLELMYKEIKEKHQIYVIAPLIEESDKIDLENVNKLEEKMTSAFGKVCKIGVMHGKMEKTEKDKVMENFKKGDISILISTTVIEVGVDVKNATMIVIFDAYRFGLSQLHQLRGRVGRNDLQSYCVLISDREAERLNIMTQTIDGFKISEEDFKLRGSGDLFGVRQSGDMNFRLADFKTDFNILLKAKEDSNELLESGNINNYSNLITLLNSSVNLD